MTIPASPNSVSLYQIKDEADNSAQDSSVSTANPMSLNDSDVRGLISKSSGVTMSFSEWRGVSGISLNTWALSGVGSAPNPWGNQSYTNSTYAQVGCNYGQKVDTANDRLEHRFTTFNSGAASVFSYAYQSYVGLDSATFEAKAVYSTTTSGAGTSSTSGPATNTWTTVSTSTYSPVWQWLATVSSGSGTRYVNGSVTFYMRASLGGTYYPNSSGYNSGSKVISLTATRGTAGPGGGGGGL
jgi:hypothetical protein